MDAEFYELPAQQQFLYQIGSLNFILSPNRLGSTLTSKVLYARLMWLRLKHDDASHPAIAPPSPNQYKEFIPISRNISEAFVGLG